MAKAIYRVDDGSIWHFDADDEQAARTQWFAAQADCGYTRESALADFGEPEIRLVPLTKAAGITVTHDETMTVQCGECGGDKQVQRTSSLLEVWQAENQLPEDKRSPHGAMCNSEWP